MLRPVALLSALLLSALPAAAQSGSFANSVVFHGDQLIISEPNTTFREGSVYVYERGENRWTQTQRLTAPEATRADGFGTVLAVHAGTLLAGQRGEAIHVFEKDGDDWMHAGTIEGPGTGGVDPGCSQYGYCGTDFGITLAASGEWLLVGAPGASPSVRQRGDETPAEAGAVHVYRRGFNGAYALVGSLQPTGGTPGDRFGASVLLDGDRALVAAPNWGREDQDAVGRVFIFERSGNRWSESGHLPFETPPAAAFGAALSLHGNQLAVGAPGWDESRGAVVRYMRQPDGSWTPTQVVEGPRAGARFGSGVAVTEGSLWVGAPNPTDNLTGSTFVYALGPDGVATASPENITLEDTVELDEFGSLIVAGDDVAVVTAPGMHHQSGSAHVFERTGAGWSDGQMLVSPPDALSAIMGDAQECTDGRIGPFDCHEVELLSFVPNSILRDGVHARGVRTNDNWGWTDPETNQEYALVGRNDGTSFIDITDPANPILVGDLPKPAGTPPSQLWRDIKTYRDHAFIVADGAGDHGMQVFDLTRLRDVAQAPVVFEPDVHYRGVASSHNIVINEETGFAYAVGNRGGRESCGGGLHMIDITNPKEPTFAGCFVGDSGTHDSQCVTYRGPDTDYQGREICLNSDGGQFTIVDVTDKDAPRILSTASSPDHGYIHQGWLTDDHRYFYQDDEADVIRGNVETTRTLIWDLSDLEDPVLITQFMGSMPASAHNLYLKDGFAYQANYRYGMHVLDIADPENPVEVGYFDTSPHLDGPGFSGAWSTYPFFESGTVIVTSLQEGLFVLRRQQEAF